MGEHLFRLDDSRSNVVVHRNPEKVGGGLHHGYRAGKGVEVDHG